MHSGNPEVAALERRYRLEVLASMTHRELFALLAGMWAHASRLRPDFPGPWQDDIEADLELARVLNGLPRNP